MDVVVSAVRDNLPEHVKQQLQGLINGGLVPASVTQQLPEDWQRLLLTPEGLVLALVAGISVFFLLLLVLLSSSKRSGGGNTVVIAGPSNSGKTTLFYQLKDGSLHNGVVASMGENAASVTLRPARGGPKTAQLVDIPGHHSMRHRLEAALKDAAAVIFLVDAVDVTPHRTEAADMLYELLTNPSVQRARTPVLVACNKMDLEMEAHSADFIRKTLEKQLDAMRKTRTAAIGKDAGGSAPALGSADKAFSFQLLKNKVTLVEASAKSGNVEEIVSFITASI